MKIHLVAIGQKMPKWIEDGYDEYSKRMPHNCRVELHELPAAKRTKNTNAKLHKQQEWLSIQRFLKKIPGAIVIALDEFGKPWSTKILSAELSEWIVSGKDVVLLIGGPDGLDPECLSFVSCSRSLSKLTMPHYMVRIVLIEQIYRAYSLLGGHPYHRE